MVVLFVFVVTLAPSFCQSIPVYTLPKLAVVDPRNMTYPLMLVVANIESPDSYYSLGRILPMVEMATKHVNRLYKGRIHISVIGGHGTSTKENVSSLAAALRNYYYLSAFIGPAFSMPTEMLAYMAKTWNIPIITPVGNTENIADKNQFPTLTRCNFYMQASIINAAFMVLRMNSWTNLVIITDIEHNGNELLTISFKKRIGQFKFEFSTTHYQIDNKMSLFQYKYILEESAKRARVFIIILGDDEKLVLFTKAAEEFGYTKNPEFVWLYFQNTHPANSKVFDPKRLNDLHFSESVRNMAMETDFPSHHKHVLFFHIDTSKRTFPEELVEEYINTSRKYYYEQPLEYLQPPVFLLDYWEAVSMYATVVNETLTAGGNPLDGRALSNLMWNRTFDGLDKPVTINAAGDRESDVEIIGLNPETGKYETLAHLYAGSQNIDFVFPFGFPWTLNGGKPPLNVPVCGYLNDNCLLDEALNPSVIIGISVVLSILLFVGAAIFVYTYQRWKNQSQRDLWWWLIQSNELTAMAKPAGGLSTFSLVSKASFRGAMGGDATFSSMQQERFALFKGQLVRVQHINTKHFKLTNDVLGEFRQIRELSHANLSRLYGATINDNTVSLVTEHCPKGSLQDLLGNDRVTLDAQFKYSLSMDIINALCYIHGSPIKWHGRLTSDVCLVDNRFSVKLTQYGLHSLHVNAQEYQNDCLWKSPEVLRSKDFIGTKESDIYSFAIILSEILSRDGPFGQEIVFIPLEEILDKVRKSSSSIFRPTMEVPSQMSFLQHIMELCWQEDPKQRPTAHNVKTMLKKSASRVGVTGSLLDNLMSRMEMYATNLEAMVEEKTEELREEKKRSEELLYQILPRQVADRLKLGLQVQPENFDCVTIYFSDIVGFTVISARSTPIEVVALLNDLYSYFDEIIGVHDVYKVETIGDAYMVVSGLPSRNGSMHASHIARMALDLLSGIGSFSIRHLPNERIKLRIGLHSGPVCAGVVGVKMPRYCLFGDTVNTASRMESHGEELRIHMSQDCKTILDHFGKFYTDARGEIEIKGKGLMHTYWLTGQAEDEIPK